MGAGKTSLARALGAELPARLIHADSHIWDPYWTLRNRQVAGAELLCLFTREDRWIADGPVTHVPEEMLTLADLVIYLDYSLPRLVLHNIKRWIVHRRRKRPELPEGCEDGIPVETLWRILRGEIRRPCNEAVRINAPQHLVRLRSPQQARIFIETLSSWVAA